MNPWNRPAAVSESQSTAVDQGLRSYMLRVYNYMTGGVLLTGIIAYLAGTSDAFLHAIMRVNEDGAIVGMSPIGWLLAFAPVIFVLVLGSRMNTMSLSSLKTTFWAYAGVMG